MNNFLSGFLCRIPHVYRFFLRARSLTFNAEKAIYLKLIRKGQVVIEVGANQGYFTELFAHLVGRSGQVFACEPVPSTRALLKVRLKSIRAEAVQVLPFAASDTNGSTLIYLPGTTHGQASLRQHLAGAWSQQEAIQEIPVECIRLDDLPQLAALAGIDFVKMDTEGAELLALKGMQVLLTRHRPILHLEVDSYLMDAFNYGANELESFLRGLGYCYFYTYNRNLIPLISLKDLAGGANVICSTLAV